MSEIETLKKALGLELENNGLDWAKFKAAHGLQPQDAKTEAADRAWFTWQHFRGEHRPNSCLLDDEGRVIGLIVKGTSLRELKLPSLPVLSYLCICDNKDLGKVEFAGEYPVLQHIDLGGNGLVELDLRIELPRLVYLNVSKNQIARLELAASLPALQELDASGNQLKNVVLPGKLLALRYLFLDGNGMESLETASSFSELRTLHLKDNQLRTLPKGDFRLLETLYVEGNPLESFDEVLIKGDQSGNAVEIIAQLRSIAISGEQPNYRAKLVIVGNGRVGKTCLIKRLRGQSFDSKEKYTHGVVISEMNERDFPGVKTDKLYLKVWDFGGQEVFYATHQFFMSEEALYIYAWTDKAIAEQNRQNDEVQSPKHRWRGHAYWLDNVRMHSKNSPLLVVRTHEGEAEELFPPDLKDKYQEGPYLNFDASIEDAFFVNRVKNAVTEALNKLPILGTSFPKNYYDLIETLSGYRQKGIAEISRAEFDTLATQYKIPEKDQDAALSYLHKTGEVIYFDSEGLKEKVYINPVALTERLYKLIEGNDFLEKHLGKFDTAYAEKVFDSTDWRELLGLLEHFALIFRKPVKEGIYIAPQYLPDLADTNENEQNMFKGHKRNRKLRFTLYYPHILPENVMVNLLCVFGPYAIDAVYRNAIYFERENDTEGCVILADEENRQIEVYTDEDPGGDSLAKSVFEKFKELSKKAEIHIAVEKGKWIKANLLEDKTRETYPTADGNDSVKAGEFRFLVGDRGEIEIKIEDMTPEEIKKIVQDHIGSARTGEAIKAFKQWAQARQQSTLLNSLLMVESDWNKLKSEKMGGIISWSDENLRNGQITHRLLSLVGEIEEAGVVLPQEISDSRIVLPPPPPPTIPRPGPAKIFLSYAHELFNEAERLKTHLAVQKRNGKIEFWHDQAIRPGENWDETIKEKIGEADIFILLLNPDFWASDYIQTEELPLIERRKGEGAKVFCVMVSDNDFEDTAWSKLQAGPRHEGRLKPIELWDNQNTAWKSVVDDLKRLL